MNGYLDIVEVFLDDNRFNSCCDDNTLIEIASMTGNNHIVELLFTDYRFNPFANDYFRFRMICQKGLNEIIKLILWDPPNDFTIINDIIGIILEYNNPCPDIIQDFLSHQLIDSQNASDLLIKECEKDRTNIVKILLDHPKIDPSLYNFYALVIACSYENEEIVKLLLKHPKIDQSVDENKIAFKNEGIEYCEEIVNIIHENIFATSDDDYYISTKVTKVTISQNSSYASYEFGFTL